jgi:hypothetical protein
VVVLEPIEQHLPRVLHGLFHTLSMPDQLGFDDEIRRQAGSTAANLGTTRPGR